MNPETLNIESAEKGNALDIQNQYNFRKQLGTQLNEFDNLRNQRKMDNLALAGATPNTPITNTSIPTVVPPNEPIDASALGNVKPTNIPEKPIPTSAAGLSGVSQGVVEQTRMAQKLEQDKMQAETAKESKQSSLEDTFKEYLGIVQSVGQMEKEAGIDTKAQKATDVTNQIEALSRAKQNEIRALEQQPGTMAQKAQRQADIERQYAFQEADLALIQSAANRDLLTAQSIVDRRMQLALEPLKIKMDFDKFMYEDLKGDLTKAEEREFQNLMKEDEREYKKVEQLENTRSQLLMSASTQQAPSSVLSAISNAKTVEEAIQAAGQYAGDMLERQIKQEQLNAVRYENQIAKANLDATKQAVENGQLTPAQGKAVTDLTVQLRNEPSYKEMFEIRAGYNTAKVGYEQSNGFGDIAMVNGYQRMIDPGATVRGEDIKTQAEATAYIQKVLNVKGKIFQGDRMTNETRALLNKAVDKQYARRVADFDVSTKARYENTISRNPLISGAVTFDDIGDSFKIDTANDTYAPFRSQVLPGEILIERNGVVGAVPENEFNPSTDTKL